MRRENIKSKVAIHSCHRNIAWAIMMVQLHLMHFKDLKKHLLQ